MAFLVSISSIVDLQTVLDPVLTPGDEPVEVGLEGLVPVALRVETPEKPGVLVLLEHPGPEVFIREQAQDPQSRFPP